jgi:hypothetical protein
MFYSGRILFAFDNFDPFRGWGNAQGRNVDCDKYLVAFLLSFDETFFVSLMEEACAWLHLSHLSHLH